MIFAEGCIGSAPAAALAGLYRGPFLEGVEASTRIVRIDYGLDPDHSETEVDLSRFCSGQALMLSDLAFERHRAFPLTHDTPIADLASKHRPEPMPPEPHRLVADVDPSLVKQILHVAK